MNATEPAPRFPVPDLADLPGDLRERMLAVQEKLGFLPNVFLLFARRPAEFRAFFSWHDALMERSTPALGKAEREMIVVATSALNHCLYCVVAHGAVLRIRAKDPLIADQLAVNPAKAPLDPRQRAMIDFAVQVASESHTVTDEDVEALRGHGLTDEDIWDVGSIVALFAASNRMANFTGLSPNPEFHGMARAPVPSTGAS